MRFTYSFWLSAKGSKSVKINGVPACLKDSKFSTSTGDEAGAAKGAISGKIKGIAEPVNYASTYFVTMHHPFLRGIWILLIQLSILPLSRALLLAVIASALATGSR